MNNSPQFKGCNTGIFNKHESLSELRSADKYSLIGLYVSKGLMLLGILMIMLNNLNIIAPGSYFGAVNWVTLSVFFIGLFINFICIPLLYFSSLKNFKSESEFWDKEIFWILPLFFFGIFFIYGAELSIASTILTISLITVALVHVKFIFEAKKISIMNLHGSYLEHDQYLVSLQYLTAYYVVFVTLLFLYNPLQHTFFWIRMHT